MMPFKTKSLLGITLSAQADAIKSLALEKGETLANLVKRYNRGSTKGLTADEVALLDEVLSRNRYVGCVVKVRINKLVYVGSSEDDLW